MPGLGAAGRVRAHSCWTPPACRLQEAAVAAAHPPRPAMGPWDIPDGKRLWYNMVKQYR
jgi:hypothetical protein